MLEIVEDQMAELKKLWKNKRLLLHQGLNLAMIVFSALMIWKGLMFLTKSESPVVVVLSGSMEPAFQRGDILFLNNQANPIRVGDSAYNQIVALLLLMAFTPSTRRPFSLIVLRAGGRGRRLQDQGP